MKILIEQAGGFTPHQEFFQIQKKKNRNKIKQKKHLFLLKNYISQLYIFIYLYCGDAFN